MTPSRWWAAALVALLLPALRLAWVGRAEHEAAVAAEARGDRRAAQVHFERAARCEFPLNPWTGSSVRGLLRLADAWRRDGNQALALSAAESGRSVLIGAGAAARHAESIRVAEGSLAQLRSSLARGRGEDAAFAAAVAGSLARRREPRRWIALAGMACLAAAAAAVAAATGRWSRARSSGPGLRSYLLALALVAAALGLLALA